MSISRYTFQTSNPLDGGETQCEVTCTVSRTVVEVESVRDEDGYNINDELGPEQFDLLAEVAKDCMGADFRREANAARMERAEIERVGLKRFLGEI